jgi:hypothetical protein
MALRVLTDMHARRPVPGSMCDTNVKSHGTPSVPAGRTAHAACSSARSGGEYERHEPGVAGRHADCHRRSTSATPLAGSRRFALRDAPTRVLSIAAAPGATCHRASSVAEIGSATRIFASVATPLSIPVLPAPRIRTGDPRSSGRAGARRLALGHPPTGILVRG